VSFLITANTMTNGRRCLPAEFYEITLGNTTAVNTSAIPPEVFEICTPSYGSREVVRVPDSKKWLALDIISTAGIDTFAFSIDEHPLWVFAVDAHYIEPLKVDILHVANGDRYSVLIRLDKEGSRYGIRVASIAATQVIATTAILSYYDEYSYVFPQSSADVVPSTSSINLAGEPVSENVTSFNQADMKSFPPQFPQPAPEPEQTFFLNMSTTRNSITWALNTMPLSHPMLDDMAPPLLWQYPNSSLSGTNVTITTKNNTWIDLVFISHQLLAPPHPIHKHSNRAFIIGQGEGTFEWESITEAAAASPDNFNLWTPPYRDGFVVPATSFQPSWLAVRYQVVNPGAWMLHCHIQSHLNGGMAMVILDGVDAWPEIPDDCKN
jgi:FtsP/CotA-like multicopper oxidase with cupredoxin domain